MSRSNPDRYKKWAGNECDVSNCPKIGTKYNAFPDCTPVDTQPPPAVAPPAVGKCVDETCPKRSERPAKKRNSTPTQETNNQNSGGDTKKPTKSGLPKGIIPGCQCSQCSEISGGNGKGKTNAKSGLPKGIIPGCQCPHCSQVSGGKGGGPDVKGGGPDTKSACDQVKKRTPQFVKGIAQHKVFSVPDSSGLMKPTSLCMPNPCADHEHYCRSQCKSYQPTTKYLRTIEEIFHPPLPIIDRNKNTMTFFRGDAFERPKTPVFKDTTHYGIWPCDSNVIKETQTTKECPTILCDKKKSSKGMACCSSFAQPPRPRTPTPKRSAKQIPTRVVAERPPGDLMASMIKKLDRHPPKPPGKKLTKCICGNP